MGPTADILLHIKDLILRDKAPSADVVLFKEDALSGVNKI